MPIVRVQPEAFDIGAEYAALAVGEAIGGVGCFIGRVRGDDGVVALSLEHYPGMTEAALAEIAGIAARRWPLLGCTIIHRVGRLPVGEPIVLVLAAARSRADALEATSFLIDWLKTEAPFWKCAEYADGRREWVEARAADDAAMERWKK